MRNARQIYELMVLTAWADGRVQPEEALAVHRIVAGDAAFAQLANKGEISRAVKARIDEQGLESALRETASAIPEDDRELAFRYCARVLNADGEMVAEDAEVLGSLQELFGLSGEVVKRLMRERDR
jgi:uncharacterized tellurite resistance protein B-like protein